jgi:Glycosyltransferase family 87
VTSVPPAARPAIGPGTAKRVLLALGIVLVSFGACTTITEDRSIATDPFAFDFNVNWVAAQRLVDHQPLYDAAASRAEAVRDVSPRMRFFYDSPFSSYIGPPLTALVHAPLLLFPHDTSLALFRLFALLGMVIAIVVTASALGPRRRLPTALVGIGGLLLFAATLRTLQLGQGHELVMLGLAAGIWGTARERWAVAGIGLGVATVLKLSPALLVVYLLLNRKWRAVGWATATVALLNVAAGAVGRPGDLVVWIRDIAPSASEGTRHMYNQALPAWLARLFSGFPDVVTHGSIGAWHLLGITFALGATFGLWRARRHHAVEPLALGVLVLVGLIAGPLTWDHYTVWALIPLVLIADALRWSRCTAFEVGGLIASIAAAIALLHVAVDARWAATFGTDFASQLAGGPYALALLVLLGVALFLLSRTEGEVQQVPEATMAESGSTRYSAASSLTATS